MELKIYSIYDAKAEAWLRPLFAQDNGSMLREFSDVANDKNHPIGKHPEDYALYELGTWDDKKGVFNQKKESTSLGLATSFVKQKLNFPAEQGSQQA